MILSTRGGQRPPPINSQIVRRPCHAAHYARSILHQHWKLQDRPGFRGAAVDESRVRPCAGRGCLASGATRTESASAAALLCWSSGQSVGAAASPSEQSSGIEELKGGQDGPDPLEVRIASPEPGGRVDSRNGDLDIGESDGMAALA